MKINKCVQYQSQNKNRNQFAIKIRQYIPPVPHYSVSIEKHITDLFNHEYKHICNVFVIFIVQEAFLTATRKITLSKENFKIICKPSQGIYFFCF